MLYNARIAKYDRVGRYIYIHKTIWSNQHIIPNCNSTYYSSIYTNPHSISNYRGTLPLSSISLSYYRSFMYITIFPDNSFTIDCNIIGMPNINTPPQYADLQTFPILSDLPKIGIRLYKLVA